MKGCGAYQQRVSKPTVIRGVRYPSRGAAARALGVTPSAVYIAIREGREAFVGTGRHRKEKPDVAVITFAKHQPLPPGYRVEWWEQDEMYHWVISDDIYSEGCADRWAAWRGAWAHYKEGRHAVVSSGRTD